MSIFQVWGVFFGGLGSEIDPFSPYPGHAPMACYSTLGAKKHPQNLENAQFWGGGGGWGVPGLLAFMLK